MKKLAVSLMMALATVMAFAQNTVFTGKTSAIGDTVELRVRSIVPTTLEVDWGSGSKVSVSVDSAITVVPGIIGESGEISVYGNAEDLWVFSLYDAGLTSVDVSALVNVTCLGLGNNELTDIDLSKTLKVDELTLSGNPMSDLDVSMLSELVYLSLSWCEFESVDVSHNAKLENLYVTDNPLKGLDVSNNPELWDLQCARCGLETLDVSHNPKMIQIMCEGNNLTQLDISACPNMRYLRCFNNYLTIGTLPLFHPLNSLSYLYAPQKPLPMPDTVGGVDFSAGYDCEGFITRYTWRTEEGRTLISGIDYTMKNGITNFLTPGLKVSGQLENDFFPNLTGEDACQTEFFITEIGHVGNESLELTGTRAWSEDGRICMQSQNPVEVAIYSLDGRLQAQTQVNGYGEWTAPVSGLYVVRMSSGPAVATNKIVIR